MPRDVLPNPGLRWYVVAVETRRELYARENLRELGFDVYLPMVTEVVRHARSSHEERRPMFGGYLFVRFDQAIGGWEKIYSTRGVVGVVQGAGCLGWVPDDICQALMIIERSAKRIQATIAAIGWLPKAGEAVRVNDPESPWAGLVGRVVAVKNAERVRLLLGALNVVIGVGQVERVPR